jgi:hypothetical protein
MEEEKNEKGFVIKDRRLFDETGDVRAEAAKKEEAKTAENINAPDNHPDDEPTDEDCGPVPEVNFAGFIYSLGTAAFYHFGDFPDPVTNKTSRSLPAAKQTIDILSMLKEKTEGNLQKDEQKMLDGLLYELRMRYVKEAEGK